MKKRYRNETELKRKVIRKETTTSVMRGNIENSDEDRVEMERDGVKS